MADTTTRIPSGAEIVALAYDCSALPETCTDATLLVFARAVLAKWGSPAPASHPYAYEFSRSNEDGTHSLHIERNELQEGVLRWWERIGPPKDAITDRPIKALYETPQAHPVAAPEPHYGNGRYLGFARHNDAYSVAQVQAMFAAVPRNATLYDPDEVAFPVQRSADGVDALPPELASIAAVGVAAEEAAAPSAPAREPLTDEQIDEIHLANSDAYERGDVEYESHGFARAIEQAHGITAAPKGGQHGTE